MHIQALSQQFSQRSRRFIATLRRIVLHQCLDRALDQDAQQGVRVHTDGGRHADRLGNDEEWIGSLGGDALDPADQGIDGWVGSVWHAASMTDGGGTNQDQLARTPRADMGMEPDGSDGVS